MSNFGRLIARLPLPPIPPKFEIGRKLDKGAYGAVYEGQLNDQPVAVKKVHEVLVDEGIQNREAVLLRFFEECEMLKDLDHPNVISEYSARLASSYT